MDNAGSSSKKALAERAIAYLEAHYMDKFVLEEMASALFVNKHYLSRVFREITGTTPLQYHNKLRCKKACELLADPHYTIAGVALRCGFTSVSHFSRIFKIHCGCTPSEYRRSQ